MQDQYNINKLTRPNFISFEGVEGCGKSTQSRLLYEYLLSKDIPTVYTREIGGTVEAEKIRYLMLHSQLQLVSELMLVMAARYEHINQVIVPALLAGKIVICDRFIDSTACYQSEDSGLNIQDIYLLHEVLMTYRLDDVNGMSTSRLDILDKYKATTKGIMPDLTFFIDLPPRIGLNRAIMRGKTNKFEKETLDFHDIVYKKFKSISSLYPSRIISISAEHVTINQMHGMIINYIFNS